MTQMSIVPVPRTAKAIFVPSGDHAGSVFSRAGALVRFLCPLPSAFMAKTSLPPSHEKVRPNAIVVASGDQAGAPSKQPGPGSVRG
jgi:hypothetical protein